VPLRYLEDPAPTLGMVRDKATGQLAPGEAYDLLNMVNDRTGVTRHRGGTTNLVSGSQTAFNTMLGFVYSQDGTPIEELYGLDGKAGGFNLINKTTGAATSLGTAGIANNTVGRPVRHFGFVVFPNLPAAGSSVRRTVYAAGQTTSTTFVNGATASMTANDQQITVNATDGTTNIKVGGFVNVSNGVNLGYYGRVVSIDSATKITVWPKPTVSITITAGNMTAGPFTAQTGGGCAASFQNRLLLGNTTDYLSVGQTLVTDRRVYYSPLPTESTTSSNTGATLYGAFFIVPLFWPDLNWFEVPVVDPIIAMEPLSENELLILTRTHPVIFRGNLTTQVGTTSPTITFDLSEVNEPYGCLSDLSVHRTPKGIVWAGAGGIYAYNGSSISDLTGDRDNKLINAYWRSLTTDATFVLHGAAYVRGHYVISGASGGTTFSLIADLTGSRVKWGRLSGAGTDIFFGLARPTNPGQVFASRWWDQTGAAPSMTNGQTVRLESMLAPYVTGATKVDSDGAAVAMSATTRTITGDAETQKTFMRGTVRAQVSSTTAGVTVTGQSKIDAADISAASVRALGNLSNTAVLTVSNATNANPIVVTTGIHGLQSDDFVDIDGVTGNTNANGRWRIAVINATSFSLVGGIGNGAFGGSPTCKKLTETDYRMADLNKGQGASLTIAGSPNNIELHGVRLAVLEQQPVMSS
jgi:hypothetical protein